MFAPCDWQPTETEPETITAKKVADAAAVIVDTVCIGGAGAAK